MTGGDTDFSIGLLEEGEIPRLVALTNLGFDRVLKQFLGKVPPGRKEGDRLVHRWHRPGCRTYALRDGEGVVQATLFLQLAGSRAVPGPLAVSPEWQAPWKTGTARALLDRVVADCRELAVVMDSVTFPQSTTHMMLYQKYGGPIRQAPFFVKRPAPADVAGDVERFSWLSASDRERAMDSVRAIGDAFHPGYDRSADVGHVAARGLGDTLFVAQGGARVGFAVCHYGPGSEAFEDDQLLVKLLYVDPGAPDPRAAFVALLAAAEGVAAEGGHRSIGAMVSTGRRAAFDGLLDRGWRLAQMHEQWLFVPHGTVEDEHRLGIASFRPSHFALAEWR